MTVVVRDPAPPDTRFDTRFDPRTIARFLVSMAVSAALGYAWWSSAPTHLTGRIDVVGHPTFADFPFQRSFTGYRVLVWEFPLVSAAVYAVLRWRGPLRRARSSAGRVRIALSDEWRPDSPPAGGSHAWAAADEAALPATRWLHPVVQLVAPAILTGLLVSAARPSVDDRLDRRGIVAGFGYVVIVIAVSVVVARLLSRRRRATAPPLERGDAEAQALSLVNSVAIAVLSFAGLVVVSRHTMVITASGQRKYWQWFPIWLGVVGVAAALAWMGWRLARGWAPALVERRLRTVLLGSVAIFLLTAVIPGAIRSFAGFDDAQSVVGADLLSRGYFPWRDFLFIHGLFEDGLRSSIGFGVFQHSIWGAAAGTALIVGPLCWVGYYLLSVWAGRRRSLAILSVFVLAAWAGVPASWRFIAVPIVFVALGEALRRPKAIWLVLFTTAIFLETVLVPEAVFQVAAVLITFIAADVVHRDIGQSWWSALRRTRCFVATGAALSAVLAVFLWLNHALTAFVNYFRIFGPGHDASGAIPATRVTTTDYALFGISMALVVLTIWMFAWRVFGRHSWSSRDWVTVAAAILAGLYGEKALGRFDGSHILQGAAVAVPLAIMWVAAATGAADDFLSAQLRRLRALHPIHGFVRQPVAVAALVVGVLLAPNAARAVWHSPANTKTDVPTLASPPLVGYEYPNVVDPHLLADLRAVTDTYAGSNGKIFDNTNALGYYFYLLQRAPASSFIHVSMAEPEFAQRILVAQLAKSRPPLVAFDDDFIGLPQWDGPRNNIRHFEVAQYLLDGWTPILRTHTILFLLRNDLIAHLPDLPALYQPAQTADLNFPAQCNWGYVPNFLQSRPSGASLSLHLTPMGDKARLEVSGWSFNPQTGSAPSQIVITVGNSVVAQVPASVDRPDIAVHFRSIVAGQSGFDVSVDSSGPAPVRAYALGPDATLHPIGAGAASDPPYVSMPDGTRTSVTTPAIGSVQVTRSIVHLSQLSVPADLSSFQLATFTAPATIGKAGLELTDAPLPPAGAPGQVVTVNRSHEIITGILPQAGSTLAVRVGSCLQWHGYTARHLYLLQTGGVPITSVALSGVRP